MTNYFPFARCDNALAAADFAAALDDGLRKTADAVFATRAEVVSNCALRCVSVLAAALLSRAVEVGLRRTCDAREAAPFPVSLDIVSPWLAYTLFCDIFYHGTT